MPDANALPVIDLGPYLAGEPGALDHAAAELRHALTETGFYTIVNHGVPSTLVHEVYRQVARFHAQPLEIQRRVVNNLVKERPFQLVIALCAAYAGAVLIQGATKLGLHVYGGWVGE